MTGSLLLTQITKKTIYMPNAEAVRQVSLHGMDEGLTLKLCVGLLESTIHEASQMPNGNATAVSPTSLYMYI